MKGKNIYITKKEYKAVIDAIDIITNNMYRDHESFNKTDDYTGKNVVKIINHIKKFRKSKIK